MGRWNGSGWTQLTYCFASLSVAADGGGQMLTIDGNKTLWIATNFGAPGWAHASVPKSTPVISATTINSSLGTYAIVLSDKTIWTYSGSSWKQLTTGGRATQISSDTLGTIYVIGMDQAIYHYNGTGWERLNGTGNTWLANGGSMEVWAIGAASGGNSIYRFSDTGLQHVRTISGSSTCDQNHFPKCGITIHTAKLQAGWNSRMGAQQSTQSYANGSLVVSASVDQNDPFACLESDTACQPTTSGNVICPVVGTLCRDSFSNVTFKTELAVTSVTWPGTPPPVGCKTGPCIYLIRSNCTPGTTPPDFNPSTLAGGDYVDWPWSAKTVSWITASFCERILLNGVGITPWVCWPDGPAFPTNINSTPPPYSCTHNP